MSVVKKIGKVIGGVEEWVAMISFIAMVVVTIAIVLCRYVFKIEFMQGEEIARYLMIWCGYSGAAYCFRTHGHVGVVVFSEMLPASCIHVLKKSVISLQQLLLLGCSFSPACVSTNISVAPN